MTKSIIIGNAQGFWGDQVDAPAKLVRQCPALDFLTLDYLSEVSMSILAVQREKDPKMGYAADFLDVIRSLVPLWKNGSKVKIVTNAGGLNPKGCAEAVAGILKSNDLSMKIGMISGDDVLAIIRSNPSTTEYNNLETGESINTVANSLVTANGYFGAKPIAEALDLGAQIVITGRTADPSLTVGPCLAHFKWSMNDYDRIAGATVAGHLIECGTQVTGGISTNWLSMSDPANIGFPIVEIDEEGSFVITKPDSTGGEVTEETVKEQLLYEIGNPAEYLSPDVTVSFLTLKLNSEGKNRIRVTGASGKAPPLTYKVSATYRDGYKSEATLTLFGRQVCEKGKRMGNIVLERLRLGGYEIERSLIECLGCGDVASGVINGCKDHAMECVMRIAVADHRKEAIEKFTKEIAPLVTSGSQGTTGYISGRPKVRPVFGYWPCLISVNKVIPKVDILEYGN